ncbi:unnamed protein product, partial [Ectocarpus sp. 13 AM-2016]
MQRLVSKPEEGGGTRQEWLDCLREMVEAHKLSRKSRPTPPTPPSRLRVYEGDGRRGGGGGGEPSFPSLFAAARTSASLPAGSPAAATADGVGGARAATTTPAVPPAHTRTRSGSSSSSSVSASGSAYSGGPPHDEAFPFLPSQHVGQRPSRSSATASSLGNGQRSATAGGGGGGGGGGLPRGRELRRLAKKIGALLRDFSPSSSLEAFEVEEARLRLWVAANIMRSRALSKATRSGARPLLFLSSKGIPNRHEIVRAFSESAGTNIVGRDGDSGSCGSGGGGGRDCSNGSCSGGGDDGDRGRAGGWRRWGGTATVGAGRAAAAAAAAAVGRRRLDELDAGSRRRGRRWLLTLARFMARPREFELRRAAAVRAFTPQKFRQEWELFWELVDPVFDGLEKTTK